MEALAPSQEKQYYQIKNIEAAVEQLENEKVKK